MSEYYAKEDIIKALRELKCEHSEDLVNAICPVLDTIEPADVIPYRWIFVYLNNIPKDNSYKSFIIQEMLMDWRKENGQLEGIRW
jgi:hypothetical protein